MPLKRTDSLDRRICVAPLGGAGNAAYAIYSDIQIIFAAPDTASQPKCLRPTARRRAWRPATAFSRRRSAVGSGFA
jgi:hypothetical protein